MSDKEARIEELKKAITAQKSTINEMTKKKDKIFEELKQVESQSKSAYDRLSTLQKELNQLEA